MSADELAELAAQAPEGHPLGSKLHQAAFTISDLEAQVQRLMQALHEARTAEPPAVDAIASVAEIDHAVDLATFEQLEAMVAEVVDALPAMIRAELDAAMPELTDAVLAELAGRRAAPATAPMDEAPDAVREPAAVAAEAPAPAPMPSPFATPEPTPPPAPPADSGSAPVPAVPASPAPMLERQLTPPWATGPQASATAAPTATITPADDVAAESSILTELLQGHAEVIAERAAPVLRPMSQPSQPARPKSPAATAQYAAPDFTPRPFTEPREAVEDADGNATTKLPWL